MRPRPSFVLFLVLIFPNLLPICNGDFGVGLGRNFNINCGGPAAGRFIPELSPFWIEGTTSTSSEESVEITGAEFRNKPALSTHRWGKREWGYAIPLAVPGEYECSLHFAETSEFFFQAGKRIFDVEVLGKKISGIDVYSEAGGPYISITKTFRNLIVSDTLFITLKPVSGDPFLSAITCIHVDTFIQPNSKLGKNFKINCGGQFLNTFVADSANPNWVHGTTAEVVSSEYVSGRTIPGPNDDRTTALYSHRWGREKTPFEYVLPVETPGLYNCSLHFAEISPFFSKRGKRVFNIQILDQRENGVDIFSEAGGAYRQVVKNFTELKVTGNLKIELLPVKGDPFISAITCSFDKPILGTQSPPATPSPSSSVKPSVTPSPLSSSVSVSLVSHSTSTFNAAAPLVFKVTGSSISQKPGDVQLNVNGNSITASDIEIDSSFITTDVLLPMGANNITLDVVTSVGARQFNGAIWIGSRKLTVNVVDVTGNLVSELTTVTAVLADDLRVSKTISTTTGTVVFNNIPERTILLEAITSNSDVGTNAAIPSQGSVSITISGFDAPSAIDNNDFSKGLTGWVLSNSFAVDLVEHEENVGPNDTASSTLIAAPEASLRRVSYRQALKDMDLKLETKGRGTQSVTRTFIPSFGTTGVRVRYRFITREIPGGFFGSAFNDFFSVVIRSKNAQVVVTETASMNGLGFEAFNPVTGSTEWRTVTLPVDADFDVIEVKISVANVRDGLLDSSVIVDFVEELDCNLGEPLEAVMAIGPIDALNARDLANEAHAVSATTNLPGHHNGQFDAFRHCYWNCRLAQEIGREQARRIGDLHEACGNNKPGETIMDLNNNSVGRGFGVPGADCRASCLEGISNGKLQLKP